MDELIAFLKARLDEDERTAKGLAGATRMVGGRPDFYGQGGPAAEAFWAHFDAARELREVETWRRILLEYSIPPGTDAAYGGTERETGFRLALSFALKTKVLSYSNHPDWREELMATGSSASGRS